MAGKNTWVDKKKIYAVKMAGHEKADSLVTSVDPAHHGFKGICFYTYGERGHMIEGHLGPKTDKGFTFISEGYAPGKWEFIELTYDNFKNEYHKIVIGGDKILEQVSNTQELLEWYRNNPTEW